MVRIRVKFPVRSGSGIQRMTSSVTSGWLKRASAWRVAARGTRERATGACRRVRDLEARFRHGSNSGGVWRRVVGFLDLKFSGFADWRPLNIMV